MAPPLNRRPGFSRKAQYSIFAAYLLAVAGMLGGLLLVILSVADPSGFAVVRNGASEVTAPAARGLSVVRQSILGSGDVVAAYFNAASKNRELEAKLHASRIRLLRARAIEQENIRLKKLIGLKEKGERHIALGRLIATSGSSARRLATLSVGQLQGVRRGQPVRAPEGLVGRVLESGPTTARILLVTDTDNIVPVRRVSDNLPAFSAGRGDGTLLIKPINAGQNPFKKGDILFTSGNGGLYAPNIPVGIVVAKIDDGAIARPIADPAAVGFVMVQSTFDSASVKLEEETRQLADGAAKAE